MSYALALQSAYEHCEITTIFDVVRGHLRNSGSWRMCILRCRTQQSCRVYTRQAPTQSEVGEELALRRNGYEKLVPNLPPGSRSRWFLLRVNMANLRYPRVFQVTHCRSASYRP